MRQRPTSASKPMRSLIRVATVAAAAVASKIATSVEAVPHELSTHTPTTALSTIKAKSTTRNTRRAFVCGQSIITPNTSPMRTIHRSLGKEHHQHPGSIWLGSVIGRYGGSFQAFSVDRVYRYRISNSHSSRRRSRRVPVLSVHSLAHDDHHGRRRPHPMLLALKSMSGEFGSDYEAKGENHLGGTRQEPQQEQKQQHQPPPIQRQQQREGKRGRGGRRPFSHITDEMLDHIRLSTSITEVIGR